MPGRPRTRWSAKTTKAKTAAELAFPSAVDKDETAFQSMVNREATRVGLWWWHDNASNHLAAKGDARRNKRGFLDCFFVGGWVMLRELKTDKGVVSQEQKELILRLEKAGADVDIWRQADWHSGRCVAEMEACAAAAKRNRPQVPDVAKVLWLMHDGVYREGQDAKPRGPQADLMWDIDSTSIDKVLWQQKARELLGVMAHALPHNDEQAAAWLAAHHLGEDAKPLQVLEALRRDYLGSARPEGLADVAA